MRHLLTLLLFCLWEACVFSQGSSFREPATITFLSAKAGSDVIAGGLDDDFFSRLFPREAGAMTQVPRGDKSMEETRQLTREFFREAVLEFDDDERTALRFVVESIVGRFGEDYPILVRRPWNFIKSRRDLCGGFSFTRGKGIILSERTLKRIVEATQNEPLQIEFPESLLLHEQMHVLQRETPEFFTPLYKDVFHFRRAKVTIHPWIDERQVTNPDGVSDDWVTDVSNGSGETEPYWIGTVLLTDKPVHTMGRDFTTVAVPVRQTNEGYEMTVGDDGKPTFKALHELAPFSSRLPIRGGFDHPNEVAAYLLTTITHGPRPAKMSDAAAEVLAQTTTWFNENLRPKQPNEKEN